MSRCCAGVVNWFSASIDASDGGKCAAISAAWRDGRPSLRAHGVRQQVRQFRRKALQRVVDEPPLHLRRHAPDLLVHGHDPAGVNRLAVLVVEDLVLRVGQLQAAAAPHLDLPEQDDVLPAREDVAEERLVQPRHANGRRAVVDHRVENLEAGTPRGPEAAAQHAPGHGYGPGRLERSNRLEPAAVFVANRKAIEQIFERDQAGVLEIRRAPGSDPLQELKGRRQHLVGRVH